MSLYQGTFNGLHIVRKNEYSVSEINKAIKECISARFGRIRVRGEISDIRRSNSGGAFFTLKDQGGFINAFCVAGMIKYVNNKIIEGLQVICIGEIQLYRSGCYVKIYGISVCGSGSMLQLIENRKNKLRAMGLFDLAIKLPIPNASQTDKIGVITSTSGAALQDVISRIIERFPKDILVYDTTVQGCGAEEGVINGIRSFHDLPDAEKPNVIIITRGGGSLEDLMPFNGEDLAKAVWNSSIPIISAVGHETDNTILDLAADARAITPTAAAEMVTTPTRESVLDSFPRFRLRISNRLHYAIDATCKDFAMLKHRLRFIDSYISVKFSLVKQYQLLLHNNINTTLARSIEHFHSIHGNFPRKCLGKIAEFELVTRHLNGTVREFGSVIFNNIFALITRLGHYKVSLHSSVGLAINSLKENRLTLIGVTCQNLKLLQNQLYRNTPFHSTQNNKNIITHPALPALSVSRSTKLFILSQQKLLSTLKHRLNQVSLEKTLNRGYATLRRNSKYITSATALHKEREYSITFADGTINCHRK